MTANSEDLKTLLPDPKLRKLPLAISDILDRAPENGILPWLEEIGSVAEEAARKDDRIGDNLIAALTFQLLDTREKRLNGEISRNGLLSIAGTSQAAFRFFSIAGGFVEQKAQSICAIANSLQSLAMLTRNDAEARSLLSRAIECGEEIIGAYPEDKYPKEYLWAHEIISSAQHQLFVRTKDDTEAKDHLQRQIWVLEKALRLSPMAYPSGQRTHLQFALAAALLAMSDFLEDSDADNMLGRGSKLLEEALKHLDSKSESELWVKIQVELGYMRTRQAERANDRKAYRYLAAAVSAYRAALRGINKEEDPGGRWGLTNCDLADALRLQAECATTNAETMRLLNASAEAFENALQVLTRDNFPEMFVQIGIDYGVVLLDLGKLSKGKKSRRLMERSVAITEAAMESIDRSSNSLEWEMLQFHLSNSLLHLSMRCADDEQATAYLRKSAEHRKETLEYADKSKSELEKVSARSCLVSVYIEMGNRASDDEMADAHFKQSIELIEDALRLCKGEAMKMRADLENTLEGLRQARESINQRLKISADPANRSRKLH